MTVITKVWRIFTYRS